MGAVLSQSERQKAFVRNLKASHPHLLLVGEYLTANDLTEFLCRTHDEKFMTKPYRLSVSGTPMAGCAHCSRERASHKKTLSHQDYCARITHLGVVPLEPYRHSQEPIKHRCSCGEIYTASPNSLMQFGCLCRKCGIQKISDRQRKPLSFHQKRIESVHGGGTIRILKHGVSDAYSLFQCLVCKQEWSARFSSVVNQGTGCPACATLLNKNGQSKSELQWLTDMERRIGNPIRHAGNIGQFHVPGTRLRVDGYCSNTNTVFEFYGDAFHGNPDVYRRFETPNFFRPSVSALRLYRATLAREVMLKDLGYRIISIWENDYKNRYPEWLRNNL